VRADRRTSLIMERLAIRGRRPSATVVAIVIGVLLALATRLPHLLEADFPLNDGGMFFTMSREIMEAGYRLPHYTSYNFESIPFAYPPLSFYMAAIISGVTGLDLIAVVRFLPLVANLATIVAVGLLARALLGPGAAALATPLIFAMIPRSYEWLIMGGGLSRSVGFMFALFCLSQVPALYSRPTIPRALLCGALAAGALSSHLEMGLFAIFSLVALAIINFRTIRSLLMAGGVVALAIAWASPWWVTVIARHGLGPFDAASLASYWSSTEEALWKMEMVAFSAGLLMATLGVTALLGGIALAIRGQLFLPLWLPGIFILVPRSAATEATVPLALMAAVGIVEVAAPSLMRMARESRALQLSRPEESALRLPFLSKHPVLRLSGVVTVGLILLAVYLYWPKAEQGTLTLDSLPAGERSAMEWVSQRTPEDAQFLVLSAALPWEADNAGEWFPVLAQRRSVLTPQGAEWLPGAVFDRKKCLYNGVRSFGAPGWTVYDIERWAQERAVGFTHIYVSKVVRWHYDWSTIITSSQRGTRYKLLWDDEWAAVLERAEPLVGRWAPPGQFLVAQDCQAFSQQPQDMQRAYVAAYGQQAEWRWVQDYDKLLDTPDGICARMDRFGLGRLGLVRSLCGGDGTTERGAAGLAWPLGPVASRHDPERPLVSTP
jgi:hypothetical protein